MSGCAGGVLSVSESFELVGVTSSLELCSYLFPTNRRDNFTADISSDTSNCSPRISYSGMEDNTLQLQLLSIITHIVMSITYQTTPIVIALELSQSMPHCLFY